MSLLTSIFGDAPDAQKKGAAPDLFGATASVPAVVSKKSLSPKKSKKVGNADEAKEQPSKDENDQSSSFDAESQKETDAADGAPAEPPAAKVATKTKEELQEEEARTIFVGNLPPDITRRALAGIFKPCGTVASARLRSMAVAGVKLPPEQAGNQNMMRKVCANTGKVLADAPKKSAQGYVVFASIDSIDKALELNSTTYQHRTLRVDRANPTLEPSHSVFVGNLPYGADEETLREHFLTGLNDEEDLNAREGSAVAGIRIVRDKETQKCKGFGYVTLRDATLVPPALQLHGSTYKKRELRVMVCGKRTKGHRGNNADNKSKRRSFEGQRATEPSSTKKRGAEDGGGNAAKAKRRRARSEKKSTAGGNHKAGMSKRAAAEQRVNKRVKKLQLRAAKGMGKKQA